MNTLKINNLTFQLPNRINDINARQLLTFASCVIMPGGIDRVRAQVLLFFSLLNTVENRKALFSFRWWYVKNYALIPLLDALTFGFINWKVERFDDHDLDDFQRYYASFFFDDETPFLLQKMRTIRSGFRWFTGPLDACADICFRQYRECEVTLKDLNMDKFIAGNDTERQKLIHVATWLYLPWWSRFAFRNRALSYEAADRRMKQLCRLSDAQLYAIYLFYAGSRKYIVQEFSGVFQRQNPEAEGLIPNTKKPVDMGKQLLDMLHIRSGNVTNDTATDLASLYDVLGHFETEARQAAAIKEQYDNQKNS